MRERPLREKKPRKLLEEDGVARDAIAQALPVPPGDLSFRDGWRECIETFALHAPNKRGVARILDERCVLLEEECIRTPSRTAYAQYEGYRAAMKELKRQKRIR